MYKHRLVPNSSAHPDSWDQLCSSGVTDRGRRRMGGQSAPQRLLTRKFLLAYQEKRGEGKGVKIEEKRRKIVKGKVEDWKWKVEKSLQNEDFFFFFFFFFWHVTFQNHLNLFWVYQNENFLSGKTISLQKKIRKNERYNTPVHCTRAQRCKITPSLIIGHFFSCYRLF